MPSGLPVLLMAASLTWPGGAALAQVPQTAAPPTREERATTYVSLINRPNGDRALAIRYPWTVHRRASVEVRLVTGKDAGPSGVRPLFFLREHMKGEVTVAVYRCQDEASGVGVREPLKVGDLQFEIVGRRNWMERPAVCVVHRFEANEPAPGTAAVYCLLQPWAINQRLLYLDLPREDFAEPGKMHVWFLRDDKVIWKETVDWPAYGSRKITKPE